MKSSNTDKDKKKGQCGAHMSVHQREGRFPRHKRHCTLLIFGLVEVEREARRRTNRDMASHVTSLVGFGNIGKKAGARQCAM